INVFIFIKTVNLIKDESMLRENELSQLVIGLAIDVHTSLGPGLLEHSYQECLFHKLNKAGIIVEKQKAMPLVFEDVQLECGYRVDLLVENKLVIEIKSVLEMNEVYFAQTLTYLRLGNYKLGLLINFNVLHLKDGIRRVVNRLYP
ncbi:GxxExxY protein, partial [Daejeonella sp.]|uniref:GxxExxY protein n=1 Tax=Daejeonella sp. TaxID=2805397 RepID=UPI0030C61654